MGLGIGVIARGGEGVLTAAVSELTGTGFTTSCRGSAVLATMMKSLLNCCGTSSKEALLEGLTFSTSTLSVDGAGELPVTVDSVDAAVSLSFAAQMGGMHLGDSILVGVLIVGELTFSSFFAAEPGTGIKPTSGTSLNRSASKVSWRR
jgi:hypothetical protein